MAEGEINDIEEIRVDEKIVTWASALSDGAEVEVGSGDSNFYKNSESLIKVEPHYGTDGQSASSILSTLSSWGSNHKLSGLCYLALRFKWNQDAFTGIPKVQAKIQGKKVVAYNSSLQAQTAAYSTNPAWCLLDYLTNERYGKGIAVSEINLQSFYDASQVCVTQVTPYSGASDINIFDCNTSTEGKFDDAIISLFFSSLIIILFFSLFNYQRSLQSHVLLQINYQNQQNSRLLQ